MADPHAQTPSPYTDLASEAVAALRGERGGEVPGVKVEEEKMDGVTITRVHVSSAEGAGLLGKAQGRYITVEAPGLKRRNLQLQNQVRDAVAAEVQRLLPAAHSASCLIVGLGNWRATPDALGPRVVQKLLVTRHLRDYVPADLKGGLRPVAAVAPGVLASTGIETGDIVKGIVQQIKPDVVLCIDALAARSVERIGTTVQIADTGIQPGSGLGTRRAALNQETLGIPVLAMGVPTVVHATTIGHHTLEMLAAELQGKHAFFDLLTAFSPEERQALVHEVLGPEMGDLVVAPKEIDDLVDDMSRVIADALNDTLHSAVSTQQLNGIIG